MCATAQLCTATAQRTFHRARKWLRVLLPPFDSRVGLFLKNGGHSSNRIYFLSLCPSHIFPPSLSSLPFLRLSPSVCHCNVGAAAAAAAAVAEGGNALGNATGGEMGEERERLPKANFPTK